MAHGDDTVPASERWTPREAVLLASMSTDDASCAIVDAALGDPDPTIRAAGLGALRRQGRLSAEALVAGLSDGDAKVRLRAAQLAPTLGHAALEPVLGLLEDDDPLVVVAALVALSELPAASSAGPVIATARSTDDLLVFEEAIATLGAIGAPEGLAVVLEATESKPAVRRRAVAALGAFEGPEVEAALDRLADDRDWQVRQAVALLRRPPLDGA
jgi:HEAT repeat protein